MYCILFYLNYLINIRLVYYAWIYIIFVMKDTDFNQNLIHVPLCCVRLCSFVLIYVPERSYMFDHSLPKLNE
ncbi:hypothetical protein Hanom_Chr15g01401001 [Helianthus anomalus]